MKSIARHSLIWGFPLFSEVRRLDAWVDTLNKRTWFGSGMKSYIAKDKGRKEEHSTHALHCPNESVTFTMEEVIA